MYYLNIKVLYNHIIIMSICSYIRHIKYKKIIFEDKKIKKKHVLAYDYSNKRYFLNIYLKSKKKRFTQLRWQLERNNNNKIKNKRGIALFYITKNSELMSWIKENLQYPILINTYYYMESELDDEWFNINFCFMSYADMLQFKLRWL